MARCQGGPAQPQVLEDRQALDLAVYQRGLTDESMRERSHRLLRYVLDRLGALMLERHVEIRHEHPEQAVSFAMMQTAATLTHLYTARFRELGTPRMSDAQIAGETVRSCLSYLSTPEELAHPNF